MNICWYKDDKLGIFFDDFPDISIKYLKPNSNLSDKKETYSKPFVLNQSLNVSIFDYAKSDKFCFTIMQKYCWNGASIPRFFWRIIGASADNRFLIPSLIHDFICENHECINSNRYLSTIIFERLLYVSKVNPFSRWLMKHSVDNYQKFCNWEK